LVKGFTVQGSEVDLNATLINDINDIEKNLEGINPEPGTLNL
jgi:hypothetical protein